MAKRIQELEFAKRSVSLQRSLGISLVLVAALGAPGAMADPVDATTYTINFAGGTPSPTSGSFTYDPDVPDFTSFTVLWNGGHSIF